MDVEVIETSLKSDIAAAEDVVKTDVAAVEAEAKTLLGEVVAAYSTSWRWWVLPLVVAALLGHAV